MAGLLHLSYQTVENHKRNLKVKTGIQTSAELIHFAYTNNLF
ncbi:MAG: LuxR C-terminal-related transcriptional regulator [Bacteroidetes bacterium]|nr:LuxR C-terminal-related transcriptional regulator [Bacteroidota bacterium]